MLKLDEIGTEVQEARTWNSFCYDFNAVGEETSLFCGGVRGIRHLVVILVLRERRSDGAAETGHTLCTASTNRSLSASPQNEVFGLYLLHVGLHRLASDRLRRYSFSGGTGSPLVNLASHGIISLTQAAYFPLHRERRLGSSFPATPSTGLPIGLGPQAGSRPAAR
jgi:hypothetical protein